MIKKFVVDKPLLELNGTLGEGERSFLFNMADCLVPLVCRLCVGY